MFEPRQQKPKSETPGPAERAGTAGGPRLRLADRHPFAAALLLHKAGRKREAQAASSTLRTLSSSGKPLDAGARKAMETAFNRDFSRIRIHDNSVAAASAAELDARAYAFGRDLVFGSGEYAPESAPGRHLLAHELAHTLQQHELRASPGLFAGPREEIEADRAASAALAGRAIGSLSAGGPAIARAPRTKGRAVAPAGGKVVLGTDRLNRQIVGERQLGSVAGYDDRRQAIAVARLWRAETAAVAEDPAGRWHAFAIYVGVDADIAASLDPEVVRPKAGGVFKQFETLPPYAAIASARAAVDDLLATLQRFDEIEQAFAGRGEPVPKATKEGKWQALKRLTKARLSLAAAVFGVPEAEVEVNIYTSDRVVAKINLTAQPEDPGSHGRTGLVAGSRSADFDVGQDKAFDIDLSAIETPTLAQGTLFHEVSHLRDYELARAWVRRYEQNGGVFVRSAPEAFGTWLRKQAASRGPPLTMAEVELILEQVRDDQSTSEAGANIRTFMTYFEAGLYGEAEEALGGYVEALLPGGRYQTPQGERPPRGKRPSPVRDSAVLSGLARQLKSLRTGAGAPERARFDSILAKAKKANAKAWIFEIDFGR
jgi:hypothetical protein